jgi:hypothetical protein
MGLRIGPAANGLGTSSALNAVNGARANRRVEFRVDNATASQDAQGRRQPPPNIPAAAAETLDRQMEQSREIAPDAEALRQQALERLEARREEIRRAAEAAQEAREAEEPPPPPAEPVSLDARVGQAPPSSGGGDADTGAATIRVDGQTFLLRNPVQTAALDMRA